MKRNLITLWIRDVLFGISNSLGSVAIIQGFLLHYGVSEENIGIWVSFGSVVSICMSLLLSGMTAKTKKTIGILSLCYIGIGVFNVMYILPILIEMSVSWVFILIMVLTFFSSTSAAIRIIFEYKLPCEIMDLDKYATAISVSGILTGIVGMGCGVLVTALYKSAGDENFNKVTMWVMIAAAIAVMLASFTNRQLKVIHEVPVQENTSHASLKQLKTLFMNKDFRILIPANLMRGFGAAIISLAAVLAVSTGVLEDSECALISTLASFGTLVSCALYMPMARYIGRPVSAIAGAVAFCLVIPAFVIQEKVVFLILYAIAYVGFNITCNAVPDLIYQNIPSDIISPFQTWRMNLLTLGTTLGTTLFGFMVGKVAVIWILIIGTAGYLVCGMSYFLLYRKSWIHRGFYREHRKLKREKKQAESRK